MDPKKLSIIVPVFNEREALPLLQQRLIELQANFALELEFVLVSDGSTDGSTEYLELWAQSECRVKLIVLSRNFGHQAAIQAGLQYATGDFVAVIDADLQDPPELLEPMYQKLRAETLDVVYAVRRQRDIFYLLGKAHRMFYRLFALLAQSPAQVDSGDFCIMTQRVAELLRRFPERVKFMRGLRAWVGLKQQPFEFDRPRRAAGRSKYGLAGLLQLALSGLTGFSVLPLRVATVFGLLMSSAGLLLGAVYLTIALFGDVREEVPGFSTLIVLMLILNGGLACLLGILGEYVAQIFLEVKGRPAFLVARSVNAERCISEPSAPVS